MTSPTQPLDLEMMRDDELAEIALHAGMTAEQDDRHKAIFFDSYVLSLLDALSSERAARVKAEGENKELRLLICGGEDAPGYAASLSMDDLRKVAQDNAGSWRWATDRATAAEAQISALQAEVDHWKANHADVSRKKKEHERISKERYDALQAEVDGLRTDASRWRALMRCGRIKMQGSSGVDPHTGERNGNNVHFGAEFWPEPLPRGYREQFPKEADSYDRNTRWGVAALTALADAVMEIETLSQPPADEPAKGGEGHV